MLRGLFARSFVEWTIHYIYAMRLLGHEDIEVVFKKLLVVQQL